MPVLEAKQTAGDLWENVMADAPAWCELEHYAIVRLADGGRYVWRARHPANKLVVVEGSCVVSDSRAERGQSIDLAAGDHVVETDEAVTFVTLGGRWGDDCGGAGIFGAVESDELGDMGDPVDYPKRTRFDRHYHDCDEYWILVDGRGTASSENVLYDVRPGDCVATRMGDHHDFPLVDEPVLAVFFETTMRGQKRRGHLWEHTHGPAVPAS
jgi:mannose-6-phosphate isomerase-like protein (cupin superfamily)